MWGWGAFGKCGIPPRSLFTQERVDDEWRKIPVCLCLRPIDIMPKRTEAMVRARRDQQSIATSELTESEKCEEI